MSGQKNWYLYKSERCWYLWEQNKNPHMLNLRTKMRAKGKGKSFLYQRHVILGTEGGGWVKGGYGMVEMASIWFPAAPTAGDHLGLLTPFSLSSLVWMWFWLPYQSTVLKNKWETRFYVSPLPYHSGYKHALSLSQAMHIDPFRCSIFHYRLLILKQARAQHQVARAATLPQC